MRTTLVIDDHIMRRLKEEAGRRGTTLSALVEGALRLWLERTEPPEDLPPIPTFDGGSTSVDPADRESLYRLMDGF